MRFYTPPVQFFKFEDLRPESKVNALEDHKTLTYLAKLRKISVNKITEKHIMSHFEINNMTFTKNGMGKKININKG